MSYNSGNELNQTSGWYETFFRGYDPALGRFLQVDPLATMYAPHSGYNYALNDPVLFNDPMGDRAESELPDYIDWSVYDNGYNRPSWHDNMFSDASMVQRGEMSLDEYAAKYGQSVSFESRMDWVVADDNPFDDNGATLVRTEVWDIRIGDNADLYLTGTAPYS